jgi:hypothetical protein
MTMAGMRPPDECHTSTKKRHRDHLAEQTRRFLPA